MSAVGFGDDHRRPPAGSSADPVGLIVAMEGVERHRQPGLADLPLRALTNRSVGDLAQRAMPSPETSTDPVRQLAAQGAVGVVDPDEPR